MKLKLFLSLSSFMLLFSIHSSRAQIHEQFDYVKGHDLSPHSLDIPSSHESKSLFSRFYAWLCKRKKIVGTGTVLCYVLYRFFQRKEAPLQEDDSSDSSDLDDLPFHLPDDHQDPLHSEGDQEEESSCELEIQDVISLEAAEYLLNEVNTYYENEIGLYPVPFYSLERKIVGYPHDGTKSCLVSDLKKDYFHRLCVKCEERKKYCKAEWYFFSDKDDCEFVIPKSLLQLSEVLELKVKHASSFREDSFKVDICGLELLFLLVASSKIGYRFCYKLHNDCIYKLQRDYIYPHLPELIENAHFYISDEETLQQLYFNLAFVYINFYFKSTQEKKKSFKEKIDVAIFHIFKRYIKRAYEQLLLSFLIKAQNSWYYGCISRCFHVFGYLQKSDLHKKEVNIYRKHCRYMLDLYDEFHKTYEEYCNEVDEKPMVEIPNGRHGIYQVIYECSNIYRRGDNFDIIHHQYDDLIDSFLEKEFYYKPGMPFPRHLSIPNNKLTIFFNEKGPINLVKFWAPHDWVEFAKRWPPFWERTI